MLNTHDLDNLCLLILQTGEDERQNPGAGASSPPASLVVSRVQSKADDYVIILTPSSCSRHSISLPYVCLLSHPSHLTMPRSCSVSDKCELFSVFCVFDGVYRKMCAHSEAKALSTDTGRFLAITSLGRDGLVPCDEPQVEDMILRRYNNGKPVNYKFSGYVLRIYKNRPLLYLSRQ